MLSLCAVLCSCPGSNKASHALPHCVTLPHHTLCPTPRTHTTTLAGLPRIRALRHQRRERRHEECSPGSGGEAREAGQQPLGAAAAVDGQDRHRAGTARRRHECRQAHAYHVRACVHACMRACVHACARACVRACARGSGQGRHKTGSEGVQESQACNRGCMWGQGAAVCGMRVHISTRMSVVHSKDIFPTRRTWPPCKGCASPFGSGSCAWQACVRERLVA
eukprot:366510-Chlamydomonas_euryale.AAC.4